MIIVIGGNKGGSGKTTIATNLAVALAQRIEVCMVDADPQRSAARWHQDRQQNRVEPYIMLLEKRDDISQTLVRLSEKYPVLIVDVAGRNSRELLSSAAVADMIIAPHQASQFDLDTLEELTTQTNRIRDINPSLRVCVLQAMASTNPILKEAERKAFCQFVSEFPEFELLQTVSYFRKVYRDVAPQGKSVIESQNKQASSELLALIDELFGNRE